MSEREQRNIQRELRKGHWQPPPISEGQTISGVLKVHWESSQGIEMQQDPPGEGEHSPRLMAERCKGNSNSVSPNTRMEKKFDTMMDMMSQLLRKIGQNIVVNSSHNNTQGNPTHNGDSSSTHQQGGNGGQHTIAGSNTFSRPLQPSFIPKETSQNGHDNPLPLMDELRMHMLNMTLFQRL